MTTRAAFIATSLLGSPLLIYGIAWALELTGFRTDDYSATTYVVFLIAVVAVLVIGLGKVGQRPAIEVSLVFVASVETTLVASFLLVAWALSQSELN